MNIFKIYENKLYKSGLVDKDAPVMGFLDAYIIWNRESQINKHFEKIFDALNINSLLFSSICEPYKTIINYLASNQDLNKLNNFNILVPRDCETRTFFHEIPVIFDFDLDLIIYFLKKRKALIIKDWGIISYGTISLEQAFVSFCSVCFACFVKFFSDYLNNLNNLSQEYKKAFQKVASLLNFNNNFENNLMNGPFKSNQDVRFAIDQAGKLLIEKKLVDSFFGNISYLHNNKLFITQTGSSLDDLKDCIDECPLDNSSCVSITASSELLAHLKIIENTNYKAILHGHPKFCVILSMDCSDIKDCAFNKSLYNNNLSCEYTEKCYLNCDYKRFVCKVPIVAGEVGSGPNGLYTTVPNMIKLYQEVIVYGHGVFVAGKTDFNEAFEKLIKIENNCQLEYFKKI